MKIDTTISMSITTIFLFSMQNKENDLSHTLGKSKVTQLRIIDKKYIQFSPFSTLK